MSAATAAPPAKKTRTSRALVPRPPALETPETAAAKTRAADDAADAKAERLEALGAQIEAANAQAAELDGRRKKAKAELRACVEEAKKEVGRIESALRASFRRRRELEVERDRLAGE